MCFSQRKKRSEEKHRDGEKQRRIRSSTVTVRIQSEVEAEGGGAAEEEEEDEEEEKEGEVILGPSRAIIRRREREMHVHGYLSLSIYVSMHRMCSFSGSAGGLRRVIRCLLFSFCVHKLDHRHVAIDWPTIDIEHLKIRVLFEVHAHLFDRVLSMKMKVFQKKLLSSSSSSSSSSYLQLNNQTRSGWM